MPYGNKEWQPWALGEEDTIQHIKAADEAGIQTFDTADTYSNGESEIILEKAIKELNLPREELVIMTKVCAVVGRTSGARFIGSMSDPKPEQEGYVNQRGLSRKVIVIDPHTPIPEIMHALNDVVRAGSVRYVGMSSCYAWQFHVMQNYALNNNLTPFISMKNHYSLVYREEECKMFPTLHHFKVSSIPWSPLARGLLTRPHYEQSERGKIGWFIGNYDKAESTKEIVNRIEKVSEKKGLTME